MAYTVLARRYRSETFDDLVGQEAVAQTLKNAINADRVAHAYLFTGTRGVGKTSMARILAKALNCQRSDKPTPAPCCECDSCEAIGVGADIDVIEIDGASNNGVDNVREMRQNALCSPARSRFKIYIIDEVHMLSTSAFNALLKTLEEPPPHVKFIFATTEAHKIMPTILSRCQRFDFRSIRMEDIASHLNHVLTQEGMKADEAVVRRVARLANGSMRDGLSLLDQLLSMAGGELRMDMLNELLGTPDNEQVVALAGAIATGQLGTALTELDRVLTGGFALEQVVDGLQRHFRDLMILRACGADTELVDIVEPALRQQAADQAKAFDDATLVYYITVMEELKRSLKVSGTGRPLLEAALVRLTASERFSDTRTLIEMLRALGGPGAPAGSAAPVAAPQVQRPAYQPPSGGTAGGGVTAGASGGAGWRAPGAQKKTITGGPEPAGAPEPQPVKTVAAGSAPAAKVSLEELRSQWPGLVERAGIFKAFLPKAEVRQWDGSELTIGFHPEDAGMAKGLLMFSDHIARMELEFGKLLNTRLKVRIEIPAAEDAASGPRSVVGGLAAPGSKPSRLENAAAIGDKRVQQVIEVLNGKIASIERIGE